MATKKKAAKPKPKKVDRGGIDKVARLALAEVDGRIGDLEHECEQHQRLSNLAAEEARGMKAEVRRLYEERSLVAEFREIWNVRDALSAEIRPEHGPEMAVDTARRLCREAKAYRDNPFGCMPDTMLFALETMSDASRELLAGTTIGDIAKRLTDAATNRRAEIAERAEAAKKGN